MSLKFKKKEEKKEIYYSPSIGLVPLAVQVDLRTPVQHTHTGTQRPECRCHGEEERHPARL